MSFPLACSTSSDCASLQHCFEGVCTAKSLFPLTPQEILGTLLVTFINSLGSASGIGGGALLAPYFILIFQKTALQSVNYAFAVVFGGSLGNYLNIAFLRDSTTKASVINYDVNLLVLPMLMIGVTLGVFVHLVISDILLYALLMCILAYSLIKNIIQYGRHSVRERRRVSERSELSINHLSEQSLNTSEAESFVDNKDLVTSIEYYAGELDQDLLVIPESREEEEISPFGYTSEAQKQVSELVPAVKQSPLFPWSRFREILILLVVVIIFGLLRGGKSSPITPITLCSSGFWWLTAISIGVFGLLFLRNAILTRRWQKALVREGHCFLKNEIRFTKGKCSVIGLTSLIAGVLGATVGIGGAMIIGPKLLDYRMPPKYSTATTSFFVIFTVFGSLFQTLLYGNLSIVEVFWFAGFSFLCSYFVSVWVSAFIKRTGKQSFFLVLLSSLTAVSLVITILIVVMESRDRWEQMQAFKHLCTA